MPTFLVVIISFSFSDLDIIYRTAHSNIGTAFKTWNTKFLSYFEYPIYISNWLSFFPSVPKNVFLLGVFLTLEDELCCFATSSFIERNPLPHAFSFSFVYIHELQQTTDRITCYFHSTRAHSHSRTHWDTPNPIQCICCKKRQWRSSCFFETSNNPK